MWNSREDGEDGKGDFLGCVTLPATSLVDPAGEVTTYDLVPDNALNVVNGKKLRLVQVFDLSSNSRFSPRFKFKISSPSPVTLTPRARSRCVSISPTRTPSRPKPR